MVVVKDDSEQDGPPPTKVESEPAGAAVSTRASFCSRLFASLRLDEKEADVFTVRAQVVLITLAMGVAEIDDCTLLALFALSIAGIVLMNILVALPTPVAVGVIVLVLVAELVLLAAMRQASLRVEEMEVHGEKFKEEDARLLEDKTGDDLGPSSFKPADELRQETFATLDDILSAANELKPAFGEQVMAFIASAGGVATPRETMGPGVKGRARSEEKVKKEYEGDPRRLKDPLRCSIVCATLADLLACWSALASLGCVTVVQVKNRFRDGAAPGGYRDMNVSVLFHGLVCEVQIHVGDYLALKEGAHPAYELCRSLGLAGDLPDDVELAATPSCGRRWFVNSLRAVTGLFVLLLIGGYTSAFFLESEWKEDGSKQTWMFGVLVHECGGREDLDPCPTSCLREVGAGGEGCADWESLLRARLYQRLQGMAYVVHLVMRNRRFQEWHRYAWWVSLTVPFGVMAFLLWRDLFRAWCRCCCRALKCHRCCGARKARRSRVTLLYDKYLGIDGSHFVYKTAALQIVTTVTQAATKLPILSAASYELLVPYYGDVDTSPIFYIFLSALVINALYPPILLQCESRLLQRIAPAFIDVALDLVYGVVVWVALFMNMALSAAHPSDLLQYWTVFFPVMHIWTVCRTLESDGASRATSYRDHRLSRRAALFSGVAGLGTIATVLFLGCSFGNPFYPPSTCRPCLCDSEHTLRDCEVPSLMEPDDYMDLSGKGIKRIAKGAFDFDGLDVRWLEFNDNALEVIEAGAFEGLGNLNWLELFNNALEVIEAGAFEGMGNLESLDLSNNALEVIEAGAFEGLDNLKWLNLNNNALEVIEAGAFEDLGNLGSLDLWGNELTCSSACGTCEDYSCCDNATTCGW